MQPLSEYLMESTDAKATLPVDFYIYNDGQKNVGFKITKSSFRKTLSPFIMKYDTVLLPIAAKNLRYREKPDEKSTNGWTKLPEFDKYEREGLFISDKKGTSFDWREWNEIMDKFLVGLKPYIKHGKVSCTLVESKEKWRGMSGKYLEVIVNDEAFNKEREKKTNEMADEGNLQKWEADEKEAKRQWEEDLKRYHEEEARRKKEFDDWYNSLSDNERECYARGYGQGRYMGD